MFCSNCGKEISNQARFCNHCGQPVNNVPAQSAAGAQPAPVKKKSNVFLTIVIFFVFAFVFTGVRTMAKKEQENRWKEDSQNTGKIEIINPDSSSEKDSASDVDIEKAKNACLYGGLYQDDVLRYSMTKLDVPGYSLLTGEGDERDWLVSPDGACLIAAYRQLEIPEASYDASTEEGLLNSYKSTYGDANMVSFKKYHVNGFPVIDYIVAYTADGFSQYQGELIIFPSETTNQTIRLAMFVDVSTGTSANVIHDVFDTLDISLDYTITMDETGTVGLNRITVK